MRRGAATIAMFFIVVGALSLDGLADARNANIPRVAAAPKLEDFEEMAPHGAATQLNKISDFTQVLPTANLPQNAPMFMPDTTRRIRT